MKNHSKQRQPMNIREQASRNRSDSQWVSKSDPSPSRAYAPRANYVRLPEAPRTTSPVPWLTSLHGTPGRGRFGDASYRGNCSGLLIKDLLLYYRPTHVLDPMSGGGTCRDVCRVLGIKCANFDLRSGFDATKAENFTDLGPFDFIWLHPPYWRMIRWTDDPRCLANAPSYGEFLRRLQNVIGNCVSVLTQNGKLAILVGDLRHEGEYLMLPFHAMDLAATEGLRLAAPEIIRFSHGTTSASTRYDFSFIPRLHDVCLVLKREFDRESPKDNATS
jgi:hypothetical protein